MATILCQSDANSDGHDAGDGDAIVISVPVLSRRVSELLDLQEQLGIDVLDNLDEGWPDWSDDLAEATWFEVGGW